MCVVVFLGQIYTDWANHYLAKSGHKRLIRDLQTDVTDGVLLADIIQVVGESRAHTHIKDSLRRENNNLTLLSLHDSTEVAKSIHSLYSSKKYVRILKKILWLSKSADSEKEN